jgi:SNF2-related domain
VPLRPTTNLVVPQHLMLPKEDLKKRFMYVYSGAYKGSETAFMTGLWAAPLFPAVFNDPRYGKTKMRQAADKLKERTPSGFLKVKKIIDPANPHFLVSVPLITFTKHGVGSAADFLTSWILGFAHQKKIPEVPKGLSEQVITLQEELQSFVKDVQSEKTIPVEKVVQAMGLDAMGAAALKACLVKVAVRVQGSLVIIFADFKITKDEAQQLTVTEWPSIRNIDIYPLILHWMEAGYGARGTVPLASFSVSSIAFSLPPSHSQSARINDLSLSIGPDGKPYYLPKEIDKQQTINYEDRYTDAGQREDGSFAFHSMVEGSQLMESGKEVRNKLPINMVVSIDWLNNKFTYTNTEGKLTVEDLTRFQPANVSHIRALLDKKPITDKEIAWFVQMGEAAGVAQSEFKVLPRDLEGVSQPGAWVKQLEGKTNSPKDYFDTALKAWFSEHGGAAEGVKCTMSEISENGFAPFAPLARYIKRIEGAVKDNIEAVYLKYSISTVEAMFPWVVMISHYTDDMPALRAKDETHRAAAINQGIDPDWKMPSVPLIKATTDTQEGMGMLPHQLKIENIMKDDPELAILPVQAGGGKSPLLLVDILLQFKANKSAPYLVLCPNHLVPNYVKETVAFTDGKLNVIAITNVAIKQNGWARLQKIMEAAPRNTVVVVALDTLRYRARTVSYGTEPTIVFPVIDFLRQFAFGYVAIDEAHKIKGKTARNKSVMALLADIPKKRLASGTFAHDSPSDLARIIGALDPTLFGTRDEFNEQYGEKVRGDRVISWKDGAEKKIMEKIQSRIVVAGAMRKEWAAFLPKRVEKLFGVELTPSQQAVYQDILNHTIEEIEKDAKSKKELQKFLNKGKAGGMPTNDELADEEDEEEGTVEQKAADEDEDEDLATMLNPYLARLEQYLIAPGSDPLGKVILKGEDLLSPKVTMCYERIRLHLFGGEVNDPKTGQKVPYGPFPGKVLVFVNQIEAAEEVFNKAPPDLKNLGILYKASDKVEILSQLENNPNKRWMVGVVQSMEEGLNLQVGARIIRLSAPWNPGSLEQSNSRIERPEFKKKDERQQVFFDTIVADQTYDITKAARLIAKVVAAAKFENTDSPTYDEIPNVPVVPMNLDTIRTLNSWHYVNEENPGLVEYAAALSKFEQVRNDDYEDYKEAYIAKHGPITFTSLERAPTPGDAKLLLRTPYVPGLGLYSEKELGLKRIDEYLNLAPPTNDEDEDEGPAGDDESMYGVSPEDLARRAELTGKPVHTEYGDGVIIKVAPKLRWIRVALPNGYEARLRQSQVFLITRTETSNKDIRKLIARNMGELPPGTEPDVPAEHWVPLKERYKKLFKEEKKGRTTHKDQGPTPTTPKQKEASPPVAKKPVNELSVELTLFVSNGFLGLDFLMDEANQTAIKVLQAHGFRSTPAYYYARMPDAKRMNIQMKLWKEKGLTMDATQAKQGVPQAMLEMYRLLQTGQIKNHKETYRATREANVLNFYRLEHKASNDKTIFKPYPIIQDGQAYIALPAQGQAGTREAMKYKRASIRWLHSDPSLAYFGSVQQIIDVIKTLREAGVTVANIKELDKEITKLKTMKFVARPPEDVKSSDNGF